MSYSPPAWNAVDFNGTGLVVAAPRWDRVNFVTPPASPAWSDADITADGIGLANHQVAFGAASIQPDALGEAWKTFFASAVGDLSPAAAGRADMVYLAAGAADIYQLASGRAVFVYLCQSQFDLAPDAAGIAYRPTYYASGLANLSPDAIGITVRGVSAFGIADMQPDALGELLRIFRCSVDVAIAPVAVAVASFSTPPRLVRCSAIAHLTPNAIGLANV